jgi:glyoxylase-like metal-dependent hydrolase (beta-lactamase superfamily II)
LRAIRITPADVDHVVCTHLHADHCGWLFDAARPVFPRASIWFGAADWHHFVLNPDVWMFDHNLVASWSARHVSGSLADRVHADADGHRRRDRRGRVPGRREPCGQQKQRQGDPLLAIFNL